MGSYCLTIPLSGLPLHSQRDLMAELADLGYTDVWSAESGGSDAFTPLALASVWAPTLRLGTAIVPAFTRGAPTIAQSAAALADAAPGRFALGIGTSSDVIVQRWNGIPFERPFERVRAPVDREATVPVLLAESVGREGIDAVQIAALVKAGQRDTPVDDHVSA